MTHRDTGRDTEADRRIPYRGDIQGLRAVAVVLVLLSHAGLDFLPGGFVGVDVFFVISGFLITGLLVAEWDRTGRISLTGFYARRAKRLLPAAGLVLVVSMLLTLFFLPRTRWAETGWDVVASGLYAMNWRLAEQAVDYLAIGDAPSILQHYWSLAVEEQFYLAWPLLLLAVGWTARRRRGRDAGRPWTGRPRGLLLALALIAVPSFAWSVHLTASDPARAYFVSTTRIWELALGGALALLGHRLARLPHRVAAGLGWAGLGAIVAAALWITPATAFPGYLALVPTLGAAAVIAAGTAPAGPGRLLDRRPMRAIGALSYSLYLWHWPLLVTAEARFGELSVTAGLAVVLFSVLPAAATYHYLENPIRRSKRLALHPVQALRLGLIFTAVPVLAGQMFQFTVWPPRPAPDAGISWAATVPGAAGPATPSGPPGAAALGGNPRTSRAGVPVDKVPGFVPDALAAKDDLPDVHRDGCFSDTTKTAVLTCVYGDRNADFTVAAVGDSHVGNWFPALQAVAAERKWRLVTYLKQACPFLDLEISVLLRPAPACTTWNRNVRAELTGANRPDVLLTTGAFYLPIRDGRPISGPPAHDVTVQSMRRTWTAMTDAGIRTVVLRDTPHLDVRVAECVSANPRKLTRCTTPREVAVGASAASAQAEAVRGLPKVAMIDLTDAICPADRCASVIGGALVYRDSNHLTATYARTLTPRLRTALDRVIGARP
ncbi:acyltransferase family protein [Jidongwangia harbinensis]|uniref:acyltransferase family protein n=1 Tax=Jidongwangia harbinensis TaxID=2878561 RepID=UPI001CDA0B49|nr:acyltransferase family protein [Jidongwangia harbinensis]MCA2218208.1 acyltransferase [Jidongwangia harbinensis]